MRRGTGEGGSGEGVDGIGCAPRPLQSVPKGMAMEEVAAPGTTYAVQRCVAVALEVLLAHSAHLPPEKVQLIVRSCALRGGGTAWPWGPSEGLGTGLWHSVRREGLGPGHCTAS